MTDKKEPRDWKSIAEEASTEPDGTKLSSLIEELHVALDRKKKPKVPEE
jgi:hypothetical protein